MQRRTRAPLLGTHAGAEGTRPPRTGREDATEKITRARVVTDSMKRQTKLKGKRTGDRYLQHVAEWPRRSDKGQTKEKGRARLTAANTLLARLTKSPHEGTRPGFPFPPLDAATQDCLRSHVCGRGPRRQASPRHLGISACPVQLLGPGVCGSFADPPPRRGAGRGLFHSFRCTWQKQKVPKQHRRETEATETAHLVCRAGNSELERL